MRIVYVEDNPANIALVQRITQMSEDHLETFSDPHKAFAAIDPGSTDLILMDINLGNVDINGLELTRMLRDKGVVEPIIVITAYDAMGYPEQFEEAGFDEYVLKPVSVRSMIELINAYRPS